MSVRVLRQAAMAAVVALGIVAFTGTAVGLPVAVAQDATPVPPPTAPMPASGSPTPIPMPVAFDPSLPTPPAVTGGIGDSSMVNTDIFPSGRCMTGWARGESTDEGFRITVSGPCLETSETADIALPGRGVRMGDGDVAMDIKVISGAQRAAVSVYVRNTAGKLVGATFNAATGEAKLFSFDTGTMTIIASRTDAQGLAIPSDWNRLAVRVRGSELWLLLNDDALLYAKDVVTEPGGIGIRLLREGSLDDEEETSVIFRGLTLSSVEGAGEGRGPVYGQ